jgi:hypothetical protein
MNMTRKVPLGLFSGTIVVLLILVAFLTGIHWSMPGNNAGNGGGGPTTKKDDNSRDTIVVKPGQEVKREQTPNPPQPPKPVASPDRLRQNLQPGKAYVTHVKGVLDVRGTDKDWGVEEVITINYAFEADIDREIESNDGTTIVELRHFRDVRSLKVETRLEDVRIDLGPAGDVLLAGIALFQPEAVLTAGNIIKKVDGASLKKVLFALRWIGISPEKLLDLDQATKAITAIDRLTGKKVRLTYVDGKGVIKLVPVHGDLTAAERDFLLASVLASDSLIVPDVAIKVGNRWKVDGSNFANMVDPGMLARTSGEVMLERLADEVAQGKTCRHIRVIDGRILFDDSDPRVGRVGHFDPRGSSLYFSPEDQVIIRSRLKGEAKLEKFSKDHLLFEARMRQLPKLEVDYTCKVREMLRVKP